MSKHRHQRGAPAAYSNTAVKARLAPQSPGTDDSLWQPLRSDGEVRDTKIRHMVRLFSNNLYVVTTERIEDDLFAEEHYRWNMPVGWIHIVVGRKDKTVNIPFHHRQHIKNQVLGVECEAVEVFPAHSQMLDIGDMFHLWGCPDPDYRLPHGFGNPRSVHPNRDFAPDEYIGGVWPPVPGQSKRI